VRSWKIRGCLQRLEQVIMEVVVENPVFSLERPSARQTNGRLASGVESPKALGDGAVKITK
jgi:hypothetical protein